MDKAVITPTVKLRLLATGEIRCVMPPRTNGVAKRRPDALLDHKREFHYDIKSISGGAQPETPASRGPSSFTRLGRDTLREFGAMVDEKFGRRALFLTWTIPGHGSKLAARMGDIAPYVQERVGQWLARMLPGCHQGWCFELQKRGMLHAHIIVAHSDQARLEAVRAEWKARMAAIFELASQKYGTDLFWNDERNRCNRDVAHRGQDAQFVEKSAARYLAKYATKTAGKVSRSSPVRVARWWRVSNHSLAAIRALRDSAALFVSQADGERVVSAAVATLVSEYGLQSFRYQNRWDCRLSNWRLWSESAEAGRYLWGQLKSVLESLAVAVMTPHSRLKLSMAPAVVAVPDLDAPLAFEEVARVFLGSLLQPGRLVAAPSTS